MALSPKVRLFIKYYVELREGKAAAIKAGYAEKSAHVTASRILSDAKVKAAVEAQIAKLETEADNRVRRKFNLTRERWVRELCEIGYADMDDFAPVNDQGSIQVLPSSKRPYKGQGAAIKKIRQSWSPGGGSNISIELHPKQPALLTLGHHFGWATPALIDPPPGDDADSDGDGASGKTALISDEAMRLTDEERAAEIARLEELRATAGDD